MFDQNAFMLWALLAMALLADLAIFGAILIFRRKWWRLPAIAGIALALALAGWSKFLYQHFFLDEALAGAAAQGDLEEVRRLLDKGASPNSCDVDHQNTALSRKDQGNRRSPQVARC